MEIQREIAVFRVLEESLLSVVTNAGAGKTPTFCQVWFLVVKIEQNLRAGHLRYRGLLEQYFVASLTRFFFLL